MHKKYRNIFVIATFLNMLSLMSINSFAETNTVDFYFSAFQADLDSSIRLDSEELNAGTTINLEDELNLDNKEASIVGELYFHFTDKTWLELGYLKLSRDGSLRIDKQVSFGDEVFSINDLVETNFDVAVYRVGINHDFLNSEKWHAGAALGFHVTEFDIGISAPELTVAEAVDKTAPIPYIAAFGGFNITKKLYVGGEVDFLELKVSDVKGSLISASLNLSYDFNRYFGIGAAYNYYKLEVESDELTNDLSGEFIYNYKGPLIFVRFSF